MSPAGTSFKFRVVALNMYGESPPSVPSKSYQVSPASPPYSDRPVAGPHISSTDAISATQILLRWTVSTVGPPMAAEHCAQTHAHRGYTVPI